MTPIDLILPMSITLGLLSYGLIAKWSVWPWLKKQPFSQALTLALLPQCFRYLGMSFLIPGVTTQPLDPRFTVPAAFGDLVVAVLALLTIAVVKRGSSWAVPMAWLVTFAGIIDFVDALVRGLMFVPPGHMGATYFIPMIVVPALATWHGVMIALLRTRPRGIAASTA